MSFVLCGRSHGGRCVVKMTEVEKKSGIYESNDGNDVIVDGKKYPITIPVANWIRDKNYQSGLNVTFEIKGQNGRTVVTKVYPTPSGKPASEPTKEELDRSREEYNATAAKMKTAGFGQPTPGPAMDTHKEVPPAQKEDDKPVVIEGQIIAVSAEARTLAVKNKDGVTTPLKWLPARDPDFGRLGQWWFIRVVAEKQGDYLIAQAQSKWQKPDDWPARGGSAGGRQYQPRNERLIAFLALHRDAVALFQSTTTPDSVSYEEAEDIVYEQAKKTLNKAMEDFGGA